MRWLVHEFYQFKKLKNDGLLELADFQALEDDLLFLLHKITVGDQVYETLIVLTRLLNNRDDKRMRDKYKMIASRQSRFFPLES